MKAILTIIPLILALCLAKKSFKDDAWPPIKISTEFELFASKMYKYIPSTKFIELMDGMNLTVRLDGANNRDLIIVGSPFPIARSTVVYRYNDHKHMFKYER